MRYRALDQDRDMTFGRGRLNFLVDSPEAVAQAAMTRLSLTEGEWFLDVTEGTPYQTQVFGMGTAKSRDIALRNRVVETQGVREVLSYSSKLSDRNLSVAISVDTVYGQAEIKVEV